jgi:hypothetical protein
VLFWYVNRKWDVSCGYYVTRTRMIKLCENVTPIMMLWGVRLSPMSDDGRGFLASSSDDRQEMLFVEFDGRHHPLKETDRSKQFFNEQEFSDELTSLPLELIPFPHGYWKQGVAKIAIRGGWLVVDTVRHSIDYQRDEQLTNQREAALRDKVVYVAPIGSGRFVVRCRATEKDQPVQVELFEKDTAKTTPLGTIDLSTGQWAFGVVTQPVIASPDGRRIVVSSKPYSTQWTVIDHTGKILTNLVDPALDN